LKVTKIAIMTYFEFLFSIVSFSTFVFKLFSKIALIKCNVTEK